MHIVAFGCSFTYGSELVDPTLNKWDGHRHNRVYRESNCWVGQLASHYGATSENLAQPSGSNHFVWQELCNYINNNPVPRKDLLIIIGWSSPDRMSWYNDYAKRWVHSGFVRFNKDPNPDDIVFKNSLVEWMKYSLGYQQQYDYNLKLSANSLLQSYKCNFLQFHAISPSVGITVDNTTVSQKYPKLVNCFMGRNDMKSFLLDKKDSSLLAQDNDHPSNLGHAVWVEQMIPYIDTKILPKA